jgi:hypothetical protein
VKFGFSQRHRHLGQGYYIIPSWHNFIAPSYFLLRVFFSSTQYCCNNSFVTPHANCRSYEMNATRRRTQGDVNHELAKMKRGVIRTRKEVLLEVLLAELSNEPADYDIDLSARWSDTSTPSSPSSTSRSASRTYRPAKNSCTHQAVNSHVFTQLSKGRSSAFSRLLRGCFSA